MENLQDFGFSVDRICESLGALCAPVLKSYIRSLPRKCESIIVLCGPHLVGSAGMSIARYLSFMLPSVNISCFYYSNTRKMKLETNELYLLEKSSKVLTCIIWLMLVRSERIRRCQNWSEFVRNRKCFKIYKI